MKKILVISACFFIFANLNLSAQEAAGLWITTEGLYVKEMKTDSYNSLSQTTRFTWFIADGAKGVGKYDSNGTRILASDLSEIPNPGTKEEGFFVYTLQDGTIFILTLQEDQKSIVTCKENADIFYDFVYYPIIHIIHSSEHETNQ